MKRKSIKVQLLKAVLILATIGISSLVFLILPTQHECVYAAAASATTYTTTDKLYINIPDHDVSHTMTTLGGWVNGLGYRKEQAVKTTTMKAHSWYDIYITRSNGWYVPKSDQSSDGKFYYNSGNYDATGAQLFLEIRDLPKDNTLMSFIWNDTDRIFHREGAPGKSGSDKLRRSTCSGLGNYTAMSFYAQRSGGSTVRANITDNVSYNDSQWKPENGDAIGDTSWMLEGPADFSTGFGIQPKPGTYRLDNMTSGLNSSTWTIHIQFLLGAVCLPGNWSHGVDQTAHFVMPNSSYRYSRDITVSFRTDYAKPDVTLSAEYSKTNISAEWADASYTFATYTLNGEDKGEYIQKSRLSDEGKYIFTVTDTGGNKTQKTGYVDKTAPKFSSDFYDASGNPLVKYTNASSYTLSFPTATANESPINTQATYVYSYYDSAAKRVVTMPAEYYNRGDKLTQEGRYVITVTDAAGNSGSCTVVIDRSLPVFTSTQYSKTGVYASYSASDAESPISATYTHTTASGTSSPRAYSSGMRLTAEGKYTVTASDAAGNSASVTLYVDNSAPVLSRPFEYGAESGAVTFSYAEWESEVTAVYSYVGESESKSNVEYVSGTLLEADGEYTVTATDKVGNTSNVRFIIDRKAPTLIFADGTTGMSQITRGSSFVSWRTERYESPVTVTYSFMSFDESKVPSVENAPYSSGNVFTAEGTYSFNAEDRAGNSAQATVIIDNTPPTLTFSSNGLAFERYINSTFTATGADALSGIAAIELYENGSYVPYDFEPRSANGAYLFRITDRAGNFTSATATVYKTDTFGNITSIRDSYKLNAWYVVTLPARIFTTENKDVAGRYSFESYDKALAFAVANEWEFRVTSVQGGYMYIAASNESVAQKYDTASAVKAVVEKYAKGYISARQTASTNGNDKYYIEPESLTRNSPALPDYLLELKSMPRYFVRPDMLWALPNISYISEMPYTVTAKYLGDYAEETTQKEFEIPRGATLQSASLDYKQGYYLITEHDVAGNIEQYLIYSDAELPTVRVKATFGDGDKSFVLDYGYTQNETLYFLSLAFEGLLDNADEYVTLKIEKGSTVRYFTQSDMLPILGSEDFTSGKYTVTVFDRSLNALTFDVFIAGNAPTMTHGSLAADKTECKISFVTSDRNNVITGITLYKIEYDGSHTVLETDGYGTPISAATLTYILNVGGKYGATVTDNYRRTVELQPIFFLKGLPSGKLAGVSDGGRTNKNVAFTFDSGDVAELYILLPGGERQPFNGYTIQTGSSITTYNITADETTSHEYLVFLHNAQDLSLFVEYRFEIDTILPEFEITDSDGNVIQPDGATNKAFSIKWQETGVSVRYYTSRGGSLSATKYNMNAVLTQGTLYYFTLKDAVGNTLEFTVLLDNSVDYTLSGKYNDVNGVLYANTPITLTVNEPTQKFEVENEDGFTLENGGALTQAGRYDITVTDNYRNTVVISIVIDITPPVLSLVGAENGSAVKTKVSISASDYDYLYLADSKGNKIRDVASDEVFAAAGIYYITAMDYAGNSVTVTFSIDLSVDYALSVPNGAVTTSKVTLDTDEPLTVVVKLNGAEIDTQTKFTDPGEYELTLTDVLGNTVSCVFIIVPQYAQTVSQPLPNGTRIVGLTKDGMSVAVSDSSVINLTDTGVYVVKLDCSGIPYELTLSTDCVPPVVTIIKDGNKIKISAIDKENVKMLLLKDGVEVNCRVGQTFDEPGNYVLTVTDELGNIAVYEFIVPFRLNLWAIVIIIVGVFGLVTVSVLIIRARRKPRMK